MNGADYFEHTEYISGSQFKQFQRCEAQALAQIQGEYHPEPSKAMMIGSYCDAAIEGTLDSFIESHPELVSSRGLSKGELKAEYRHADNIISRCQSDPLFTEYLEGDKQTIHTGEIAGVPFKGKLDILHPDRIVDFKTTGSFRRQYSEDIGAYVSFAEAWRYDIQGAIYQELVRQSTGNRLPFFLAAVTTEPVPDIAIIEIPQADLDTALAEVKHWAPKYQALKLGFTEPIRCERCDYCKATKKLTEVIDWREL